MKSYVLCIFVFISLYSSESVPADKFLTAEEMGADDVFLSYDDASALSHFNSGAFSREFPLNILTTENFKQDGGLTFEEIQKLVSKDSAQEEDVSSTEDDGTEREARKKKRRRYCLTSSALSCVESQKRLKEKKRAQKERMHQEASKAQKKAYVKAITTLKPKTQELSTLSVEHQKKVLEAWNIFFSTIDRIFWEKRRG